MPQLYREIKINPNIIFTSLDDKEGLLINIRNIKYYILNDTAWYIWISITKGLSLEKIIKNIKSKSNIPLHKLRRYIYKTAREMRRLKLIKLIE